MGSQPDFRNSKYLPQIEIDRLNDPFAKKNFKNLQRFFDSEVVTMGFRFVDFNFDRETVNAKIAHGLGYVPKDVIVTRVTGTGSVTFNYAKFDKQNIDVTATGPAKVRCFIGTYKKESAEGTADDSDTQTISAAPASTTDSSTTAAAAAGQSIKIAVLKDVKGVGVPGGTFTGGSWVTRDLNYRTDPSGFVTLNANNQFLLAAGTYKIVATVPFYDTGYATAKLRNITDATDTIVGSAEYSFQNATHNTICDVFTITKLTAFEIQHQTGGTIATNGLGIVNTGFGVSSVFTQVEITKLS